MPKSKPQAREASVRYEHSVPCFWPLIAMMEVEEAGLEAIARSLRTISEVEKVDLHGALPVWSTPNQVVLDLHTVRLRDFSEPGAAPATPVVINPPYAGHNSAIADYHRGQSLVETLRAGGCARLFTLDWKAATPATRHYDIDNYLAELNVVVDDLGGLVDLVGLCQGGWFSAMYAARYPHKVRSLVLAGAPIDTHAGTGPLRKITERTPMSFYEQLVAAGQGVLRGRTMIAAWKSLHPTEQYVQKYFDLYAHVDDAQYRDKFETFERWYENPIDLPGRWYLQVIEELFKENRFALGRFTGLGRRLSLADIRCPTFLLAGEKDDITPAAQVFAAAGLLGTPKAQIVSRSVPGGHIGLFMGSRALHEHWPEVARWLRALPDRRAAA